MKRRSFIRHVGHSLAVPGILGSLGFRQPGAQTLADLLRMATSTDRVLVMIYLEGGNDGLNTVVPMDQLSALNTVRPHVILPENSLLGLSDAPVGLHPALSGLYDLYTEDRLQIIQNVGYPQQNYSHFRSTDIWMSASDSNELVNSGWSGRYLSDRFPGYPDSYPNDDFTDPLSVELGYGSSLLFQGPESAMSMVISDPEFFYELVDNEDREVPDSYAGDKLHYIRVIEKQSQQYGKVVQEAAEKVKRQADFPQSSLGQQLQIVSRLIAGGLRTPLYLVRLGGFDTHDAQVEALDHTTGEHADLLSDLNDSIMAFIDDLEMQGTEDRVVGMTFSEFGRRIVSNASLGTDHGAAAPMFFFGNAVMGGVTGSNPIIKSTANYDDNLEMTYDFRQTYSSILQQWLGADASMAESALFKGFEQIPIIGSRTVQSAGQKSDQLMVYPNPLTSNVTVAVKDVTDFVTIDLVDMQGKKVESIFAGVVDRKRLVSWRTDHLSSGRYLVILRGKETHSVFSVVK
ncbi:DUF1501 domain-containing protein [Marinoscillum sp.]|uniref:DUF1501 domain-containing protein n=1 Tax=Marinoscillum sp. TaxID=2024838 RepID=UPI003BAB51FC